MRVVALGVAMGAVCGSAGAEPFQFFTRGESFGMSSDGNRVIGYDYSWARSAGYHLFTEDPGFTSAYSAHGISGDGSTVVGGSTLGAVRYQGLGTFQNIGKYSSSYVTIALAASRDGSVVVGQGTDRYNSVSKAFRWTQSAGYQPLVTLQTGSYYTTATGVSADGNTVVGWSANANGDAAFVWTQAGGMQQLETVNPGEHARARAVNADGSIIVGDSGGIGRGTVWRNGVARQLPTIVNSPAISYIATAMNADASLIGGFTDEGFAGLATVWTPSGGIYLVDYLKTFGITVPDGYTLDRVWAISADGKTIAGEAETSTRGGVGFVVTIPATGGVGLLGPAVLWACRRRRGSVD